jgi:peptidoglycan/xylan/chitin deacetylase (PgdA/CDA1 family)
MTSSWPGGHSAAVAVTVDLDAETMWTSKDAANARRPVVMSQAAFEIDFGVDYFLEAFADLAVVATFFVPGWVAERHPSLVRRIAGAGHEIASHGYDHTRISAHPPEFEKWTLTRTKDILEELVSDPVLGYRAPYFEMTEQTLDLLRDLGMTYSSNLMNSVHPYRHPGSGIVELPVAWMWDDGPYYLFATEPPNHRQMFPPSVVREAWYAEFRALTELGGMMNLVLHPQLSARPSRLAALKSLLEQMASEGAWLAPCRAVADTVPT